MKYRLQFSLAKLLVIVTVSALVAHWHAAKFRAENAGKWFRSTDTMADDKRYDASVHWLQAELQVPFCDREQAYVDHLKRMETIERRWRLLPLVSMVGGGEHDAWVRECNKKADNVHVWVEEADRWLDEAP